MTDRRDGDRNAWSWVLWTIVVVVAAAAVWAELGRPTAPRLQTPPISLDSVVDPARVALASEFRDSIARIRLLGMGLVGVVAALLVAPALRRRVAGSLRVHADRRAVRGRRPPGAPTAGVVAAVVWAVTDVLAIPLAHAAWQRSTAVGLSVQTFPGVLRDRVVVLGTEVLVVGLSVALVVAMAQRARPGWVPAAGLLLGTAGAVLILLSPLVFEPLLLDFTPLEDGPLRDEITRLADEALDDPIDEVLVADASRRTTASNAYVSGLRVPGLGSTRRIVLYDTLLADAPQTEVLAIIGHELSHRANRDLVRGALFALAGPPLLVAAAVQLLRRRLRDAAGRVRIEWVPTLIGVALIANLVAAPVGNLASRRAEAAADVGAIALTGDGPGYAAMMVGLAERNLSDPSPDRWQVVLWYSHPPIAERITRGLDG